MDKPIEEFVVISGCRIRLLRGGREGAPPLVFLHGAGGHTGWMSFLAALAEDFQVFAPEHPGFGQSDDPAWLDGVGDLAYFYLDALAALGLGGVHLVGTSLGGWIAAELAVRNDTRLKTLTLVGAVGIPAGGEPIDDIFRMSVEENLRRFYADQERATRRLGDMAKLDAMLYAKNRSTVTRLAYNPRFYNPDLAKWLHRITVPTLLIYGDKDGLVPPRFGEAYHAAIPQSKFVVMRDAGHAPFDEQKDAFLATFRGFVGSQQKSR
jgi:pimeloyl-ACP methyl ester carboxylesterase